MKQKTTTFTKDTEMTEQKDLRNRRVEQRIEETPHEFMLYVTMDEFSKEKTNHRSEPVFVGKESVGRYAFVTLQGVEEWVDYVKGGMPESDEVPIMYVGDNLGKHYWQSHNIKDCDVDVLEWLENSKYTVYENVDGGWQRWNGRPEFSDKYVNFTDVQEVNLQSIIEERRE